MSNMQIHSALTSINTSPDNLAQEIIALKIALGLILSKMPEGSTKQIINSLISADTKNVNRLGEQLFEFISQIDEVSVQFPV